MSRSCPAGGPWRSVVERSWMVAPARRRAFLGYGNGGARSSADAATKRARASAVIAQSARPESPSCVLRFPFFSLRSPPFVAGAPGCSASRSSCDGYTLPPPKTVALTGNAVCEHAQAQPTSFHQHPRPHEVGNCEVNDATNDALCRDWIRPRSPTTRAYGAQIEEVATTHRRFARFPRRFNRD